MNRAQYMKDYYLFNKKDISASKAVWYLTNKARLLEKNKKYSRDNREAINAKRRERRSVANPRYKEKQAIRKKVARAVKSGKLIKLPCVKCGKSPSEGHHPDYNKPLFVIWLCRTHHTETHRTIFDN